MIPLLSGDQIRKWDTYTLQRLRISETELMEQASVAFVESFTASYTADRRVYLLAGKGNNGGDGFCIARLLSERGYRVEVYFFGKEDTVSPGCRQAMARWRAHQGALRVIKKLSDLQSTSLFKRKSEDDLWIDALLGTGLGGPLRGELAQVVEALNQLPAVCVSVDLPSGLELDRMQEGVAVSSDYVISFQLPKRAFLLPQSGDYIKRWTYVDIGLSLDFLDKCTPEHGYMIEENDARGWLPYYPRHVHKNEVGRGLLVAGRAGVFGAALLSARAAVRGGIGALHLHTPYRSEQLVHVTVPEALFHPDAHPTHVTRVRIPEKIRAIAVGPGIGTDLPTAAALRRLFKEAQVPLILDADALNLISIYPKLLEELPFGSLLTPHEGELARLVGKWSNDYDKIERTRALAKRTQSTVIIKGAYSLVVDASSPLLFNSTGNPGMATAGSGDVLTGLLLALRSSGLSDRVTASLGVFLHGRAGDIAAERLGTHSLIASDIIEDLPSAFLSLERSTS